ncbi:MAG TPA: hypothetical protein VKK19_18485 [Candidatus Dormibacteraeota bacterium]|nr:hypothetical protein [Candidatus Dormibacteraeota bacterium]
MTADGYNYRVFPPEDDVEVFARWTEALKVGTRAPDPELLELASGQTVALSSYTRRGLTVVELGSLT